MYHMLTFHGSSRQTAIVAAQRAARIKSANVVLTATEFVELPDLRRWSGVMPTARTIAPGMAMMRIIVKTYGMSTKVLMYLGSSSDGRGWWPRTAQATNQVAYRDASMSTGYA